MPEMTTIGIVRLEMGSDLQAFQVEVATIVKMIHRRRSKQHIEQGQRCHAGPACRTEKRRVWLVSLLPLDDFLEDLGILDHVAIRSRWTDAAPSQELAHREQQDALACRLHPGIGCAIETGCAAQVKNRYR